ncbi:response regulator, partial [Thermodesulfobacteriota bacterium]
ELANVPFIDFIHPEDREMVLERHAKRLKGDILHDTYSFRINNRDGVELWVELSTVLISWEGQPATLNFLRDITPQKKIENQLLQAQKMEAIGTLAGGIAHDFNNLLMGIQGNASLMMLEMETNHPYHGRLKGIEQYVQHGAELTKQLLGFARGGKYEVKPTNLNEIIDKSSEMFVRTKKEIKVHKKYKKALWTVEVDQGQIEQVLLNLYVNAWQAMPAGGELYIETKNAVLDNFEVEPFGVKPGKYVTISVTDTGVGMDEEIRARIFDPFFTTKEMGRGTGLGLASAYGIIKSHNGFINVSSKKDQGASFTIHIPASRKDIKTQVEPSEEIIKGSGKVLLVDDEVMIIDVGKQMLDSIGYHTLVAKSGKEALEIYQQNQGNIDIVILDMIMPEMSGGETYDMLKQMDPDIKVLLSSGYSHDGQADEILERGCDGFIQKPFNLKGLSKKLREILDKK